MGVLAIGLENAPPELVVAVECEAVAEASNLCHHHFQTSVTAVVSLAILPRIVIFRRMPAITAVEVAILRRTARNPRERESSAATTVASLATWLVTVIMQMSKSVILVGNLDTSRRTAPKSNAIGVVKLAM